MKVKTFELTAEHILLLRASYVNDSLSDCEYGAAEIDCKRPYGNSDVESDIAEILGIAVIHDDDGEEDLRPEDRERCRMLHEQTPIALQIVLSTGSFVPGLYEQTTLYGKDWKLQEETVSIEEPKSDRGYWFSMTIRCSCGTSFCVDQGCQTMRCMNCGQLYRVVVECIDD